MASYAIPPVRLPDTHSRRRHVSRVDWQMLCEPSGAPEAEGSPCVPQSRPSGGGTCVEAHGVISCDDGRGRHQYRPRPIRRDYFHSQVLAFTDPASSTSYSNAPATLFALASLADEV